MTIPGIADPFAPIADDRQLAAVCRAIVECGEVAVDSESNALYAYQERVCLIQLALPGAEYIVDLQAGLTLDPLGEILADPSIEKVFHAAAQDLAGLKRDWGFRFANLFDTMWAARILGWPQLGLADILRARFGVFIDKRFQRANWGERPLSAEALAYARLDVRYLLPLRTLQRQALREAGREEEAAETFAQLAQTPPADPAYGPAYFWRIKGVYDLAERDRAVLWQLYLWRDRVARRRDRPPFKVLNDATLIALAKARPHSPGELEACGLKAHHIQRYGPALLSAVARGERGPAPRPQRHPRHDDDVLARYEALHAWRLRTANARGVVSDVILSSSALWALAERNPTSEEEMEGIPDMGPWRRRTYGPQILRLLHPERGGK